ncbi:ArpU family phage transcriptional regulator [Paenibacillus shirakamiensis]|uniref:ArpU family phage transcriptional regulator n=1 Tax=Paenibacillus shirakamiensis TaxID=1265935 RepID=A0ABS4JDE1_9BACL|nr:ArpU family phage packaging/lysis transcriptional regulator [Paenibacillus shirakamiensis]MBP1999742.1 ArpU family phage transcriptional regulator [Paenibacillus shirakamiensis]
MEVEQLSLGIYKVNEEETRVAVEKYLLQAREYKVTEYIPEEPSITASYSDMPRSYTGVTSDQTGNLVTRMLDEVERRRKHVERAEKAIGRLGWKQQKLIRARYMDEDDAWDYDTANQIGYSERHYRRIKSIAIYRLASTLGLIVLKE